MPNTEHVAKGPEVYVWLSIVSARYSPDEISEKVGMPFDRGWRIGDRRDKTKIVERKHRWILDSRLSHVGPDPNEHLTAVLKRVRPFAERIKHFAANDEVTVHFAIYTKERFGMLLDQKLVGLIASLGAQLDVETFVLPAEALPANECTARSRS